MADVPEGTGDEQLLLSPTLLVLVRADGIQLQRPVLAPPFHLDLAGLHLLSLFDLDPTDPPAAVAEAASRAGVDAEALKPLNLLLRVTKDFGARPPWSHREVEDHPAVGSSAPFDLDSPDLIMIKVPMTLRLHRGRYEVLDHDARRVLALDPAEAWFLSSLAQPTTAAGAVAAAADDPAGAVAPERAAEILGLLDAAALLRRGPAIVPEDPDLDPGSDEALGLQHDAILGAAFDAHFIAQNDQEAAWRAETGEIRPRVIPVAFDIGIPAALTMILAHAKDYDGGRLDRAYEIRTDWLWNDDHLEHFTAEPAIYLFSNYLWSHKRCLEVSRRVKELSPQSITVHGGPDTPKYADDVVAYFDANPHVDVTVRGEGEATAVELLDALRSVIGSDAPDLSVLADVAGLSYRTADGPVRTADRDRIAVLDDLPSPFLSGMLDAYSGVPDLMVTIETNRGCPYGCTFCDWGSATTSRVRKFDMQRVFDELAWCAEHKITSVSVADANFGMFPRDVEIADEVSRLRSTHGWPKSFGVSYAKNTVKHLEQIIGILTDAGVMSQGVLSLQSMDADTLQVIHRSNIKTARYDALADRMREAQLPLMVELMMGLPGQTVAGFAYDLQECIEREVPARINRTTLLVNSPMNDPEYLAEHQIKTHEPLAPGHNALVISTSTFTEADWREMEQLRILFGYFENYGVLRLVARLVRQETGVREIDLYREMRERIERRTGTWPVLEATVTHGSAVMAPIASWGLLLAEVGDYLEDQYGLTGTPVRAVLAAQHAILPSPGRSFPVTVDLDHDVVSWQRAVLAAKTAHGDTHWTERVPRLAEFPPGQLTVDDPGSMSDLYLGLNRESIAVGVSWELDSPLSRAHIAAKQLPEWVFDRVFPQRSPAPATAVAISAKPA